MDYTHTRIPKTNPKASESHANLKTAPIERRLRTLLFHLFTPTTAPCHTLPREPKWSYWSWKRPANVEPTFRCSVVAQWPTKTQPISSVLLFRTAATEINLKLKDSTLSLSRSPSLSAHFCGSITTSGWCEHWPGPKINNPVQWGLGESVKSRHKVEPEIKPATIPPRARYNRKEISFTLDGSVITFPAHPPLDTTPSGRSCRSWECWIFLATDLILILGSSVAPSSYPRSTRKWVSERAYTKIDSSSTEGRGEGGGRGAQN